MIVAHHTTWNYMKSKKANKKFDFKVFTETVPNELKGDSYVPVELYVTTKIKKASLLFELLALATRCISGSMDNTLESDMVAMMRRSGGHCQEPASVAFSVLSLAMHFHGWLSFFITLYYKLPLKQDKYVTVSCPWTLGSGVQFSTLGMLTSQRGWTTHLHWHRIHLKNLCCSGGDCKIHGWNMIVCVAMGVAQLFVWARWAAVSRHPSNWKLWWFKIDDSDLKNKGGKPTIRVSNVGHALHVWLSGEYHGNEHGSHDEKSPWSLSGSCLCFHTRDVDITKRLDYSSGIAVLGFSLIVYILRTFDVRVEATRVMVSAPVLALVTTHVLLEHDCVCAMGVAQLFLWARWAAVSRHPSNWKLCVVVIASGLAMLLEIYDFPPYGGYFDAHSIWHLATVPLTILWWSFIRDDAEFRTSSLLKKSKTKAKDVDITKRLDYSSAIAVLGFSFIVSILRTFAVRVEAQDSWLEHDCVCGHGSRSDFHLGMLLEIYDFPPYESYFDAHSISHPPQFL
ncbi:hypothetical protein F2Q68_00011979 [Brassica cretica]|uniref:Post-GPI attachment to proteins factor 3 n=1 Tax=Brassica cretica TaxID=69181 RepID=A0A8S9KWM8_BRACR|nr:hypothetical protein F2Q68_00011979 [Brassica cretica]